MAVLVVSRRPIVATQWFKPGDHQYVTPMLHSENGWVQGIMAIVEPGDWILEDSSSIRVVCSAAFEADYTIVSK